MKKMGLAVILGLLAWPSGHAQPAGLPIKIGAIASLTGPLALTGQAQREGYLLAAKILNQRGGIAGRPIELILEDDASNPDTAITKANYLLGTQGVRALLGPGGLGPTVAVGGIAAQRNVPELATAGIGLPVERDRHCVFHMMPPQSVNAEGLLAYATEAVHARRIAILHDSGFGQAVMNSLRELAPSYGVTFVEVQKYDLAAMDMSAQSARIKAANPDLVFVISASATPFRNLRQLRMNAPMVTPIAAAVYETVKAMGDSAEGVVFAEFLVAEQPTAREAEFVGLFHAEYGHYPKNFEAAAWQATFLIAEALSRSGPDASSDRVCDELRSKHAGVHTNYDFSAPDMTGITVADLTYSQIVNGSFVRLPFKATARN